MTEVPRPLHRLTPLRDDPAAAWLSAADRRSVGLIGWLGWAIFILGIEAARELMIIALGPVLFVLPWLTIWVLTFMLAFALRPAARRTIIKRKSARMAALLRQRAPNDAMTIDDWAQLESAPEDQLVSVVGWVRGRSRLAHPVGGAPCIGLAFPCQQVYPGVLETLHDFELVDETGRSIPIQVADGRMLGEPTVDLGGGDGQRILVAALDLPVAATPVGWHAHVLRDGDPLLIVGFKRSMVDPTERGLRQSPIRAAVASGSTHPLLIFPIDAERRTATPRG